MTNRIQTIVFDFSRVILFPKDDNHIGGLNPLHDKLSNGKEYDFLSHFKFNEDLLKFLEKNKDAYALYIFTTGHIQETQEVKNRIKNIFKAVFSVENIPFSKKDPEGYRYVLNELHCKPEETIYVDDMAANVVVASQAGLKTILFQDNTQLFEDLKAMGVE